jgi:hypothetical protein
MKNKKSLPKPRNIYAAALVNFPSAKFHHKTEARGGATNEQVEFMAEYEEDLLDLEEEGGYDELQP